MSKLPVKVWNLVVLILFKVVFSMLCASAAFETVYVLPPHVAPFMPDAVPKQLQRRCARTCEGGVDK